MGLEQLTATIMDEAKREAEAALASAEAERKKMISDLKASAMDARKAAEARTAEFVEAQRRERIAWARLEAKRMVSETKEGVVEDAIEDAFSKIRAFPKNKAYPKFLNSLIQRGVKELGEPSPVVRVRKEDKRHVKAGKFSVKNNLEAWGGCVVESSDGSVSIDLTLTALLSQKRDALRKRLYENLFR